MDWDFLFNKLRIHGFDNLKNRNLKPETKDYSLEAKYLSASSAAIQPVPAAVIA